MARNVELVVRIALPPGATPAMAKEYVHTALLAECGIRMTEDPMAHVNRASIKVTHQAPAKK